MPCGAVIEWWFVHHPGHRQHLSHLATAQGTHVSGMMSRVRPIYYAFWRLEYSSPRASFLNVANDSLGLVVAEWQEVPASSGRAR